MRRLILILIAMIGVSQAQTIQFIGAPTTTVISRGNFRTDSIFYLPKRSKLPTDTAAFRYQISDSSLYVWTGSQWIKAGGSGTITGSGITGYLPQFNGTTTIDTSALFTLGNRLGIGSSTFAYTSTNTANVELNGTAGGIVGFKRNDSARGYLWHTGDNMELANTTAGSISFNTNSATRGSISSAGVWRLHNLSGTGDRVVVASSNGTLSASTSVTGLVDTTTISTRAWRQKGIDSVVSIIPAAGVGGSGTTNYVPKFTAGTTIGNSQIFDNGTNVGLGTASPSVKLDVVGSAGTIVRTKGGTGSAQGSAYYVQLAGSTSTLSAFGDRANIFGGTVDQIASIYTGSSIPLTFDVNTAERMRITSGGNVGIGTASPATYAGYTTLAVNNATNGGVIDIMRNNSVILQIFGDAGASGIGSIANVPFTFKTNNTEQGRINPAGEFLLNSTNSDAGDYKLQVSGNIYNTGSAVLAATSGNVGIGTPSPASKLDVNGDVIALASSFTPLSLRRDISSATAGVVANFQLKNGSNAYVDYAWVAGGIVNATTGSHEGFLSFHTANAGSISERGRFNNNGELLINTTSDAGDYKLQVSGNIYTTGNIQMTGSAAIRNTVSQFIDYGTGGSGDLYIRGGSGFANVLTATNAGEVLINTTTDAGDYKLQVSGNALVTAGKLDITTNTAFGLSVSRSGTSVVAGQINNSNGILYYGAESSTGGGLFTGSSAYAAVIGSGAAYPLQFATDNVTRATINTNGELLIATTTDNGDFKLQVNGSALVSGSIQTANPVSGTAVPWRLGSVVATNVQLDTANYVEVNINGTFYRLAIVTPL